MSLITAESQDLEKTEQGEQEYQSAQYDTESDYDEDEDEDEVCSLFFALLQYVWQNPNRTLGAI